MYVRDGNEIAEGNRKLLALGAKPFTSEPGDEMPSLLTQKKEKPVNVPVACTEPVSATPDSGDIYTLVLPVLLSLLADPKMEKQVAEKPVLIPARAKAWLMKRPCDEKTHPQAGTSDALLCSGELRPLV